MLQTPNKSGYVDVFTCRSVGSSVRALNTCHLLNTDSIQGYILRQAAAESIGR